jgi:antitoxin VapB
MALNIKNAEVERLATEIATMAKESKTEAIRKALEERKTRLTAEMETPERKYDRLWNWLQTEVWPNLPPEQRGKRLTKDEEEEILGIGPEGY